MEEVVSEYEQSREKRIKENLERMQKLGIVDLSLKLKSIKQTPNRPYTKKTPQSHSHALPTPSSGPVRRSSRLQNSTPVSYSEVQLAKNDKYLDDDDKMMREVGSKPEVYNEEHEKLLGSTEMSWTLFVDGYGKDGKRIYDPVRGKTCHQCRQKTLGHRTNCSNCNMVQGQFCGDCLYMRYGEHVLEANSNPNWICPACRGICNCSFCRQAKGWPPTGTMYRKISSLGYKSVAHYLIQTRRASEDSDQDAVSKTPVSAKRSLPFSETETTHKQDDLSESNGEHLKVDDPLPEPVKDGFSCENEKALKFLLDNKLDVSMKVDDPLPEPVKDGFSCENEKALKFLLDNKLDVSMKVSKTLEGDTGIEIKTDDEHLKVGDPLTEPEMAKFSCENENELKSLLDNKLDESMKVSNGIEIKTDDEHLKVGDPLTEPEMAKFSCENENELKSLLDNKLDESMKVSNGIEIKTDDEHLKVGDHLTEPEMAKFSCENENELKSLLDDKLDESMKVSETPEGDINTEINAQEFFVGSEASSKFTEEGGVIVPTTPDSIGGRLRKRRNDKNDLRSLNMNSEDVKTPDVIAGNSKQKSGNRKRNAKDASVTSGMDSIARRLKMRRGT